MGCLPFRPYEVKTKIKSYFSEERGKNFRPALSVETIIPHSKIVQ